VVRDLILLAAVVALSWVAFTHQRSGDAQQSEIRSLREELEKVRAKLGHVQEDCLKGLANNSQKDLEMWIEYRGFIDRLDERLQKLEKK
jgi:hypothetical protein